MIKRIKDFLFTTLNFITGPVVLKPLRYRVFVVDTHLPESMWIGLDGIIFFQYGEYRRVFKNLPFLPKFLFGGTGRGIRIVNIPLLTNEHGRHEDLANSILSNMLIAFYGMEEMFSKYSSNQGFVHMGEEDQSVIKAKLLPVIDDVLKDIIAKETN